MNYVLPALDKFYTDAIQEANQVSTIFGFNHSKTREFIIKVLLFEIYAKNDKFVNNILEFNEITTFFLISLNNLKYIHNDEYIDEELNSKKIAINEDEFINFKNDYFKYMDATSNIIVSSLPEFCIINIVNACNFFSVVFSDIYFRNFDLIKNLTNFALIYSFRTDIIHNQHLRSQIFDILLSNFDLHENDKKNKNLLFFHQKLLKDSFIKENLIFSIMRVFIDAERLGTANQFYERFYVRNKVLRLVNIVFKKNIDIFKENIINYANIHSEDAYQMISLLLGDVSYLSDEVIQKLIAIKKYEDLMDDKEIWNSKNNEERKREINTFNENEEMLKIECRLLNHFLGFMTLICSCLQKYFIKEKKAERLATLLNYCLNEFISKSSQLKVKNRKDYDFKPSYIMESLIKIYSYFANYEEFTKLIVKEESFYKYDNFLKAIKVKNGYYKVKVDFNTSEIFDNLVYNKINKAKENIDKNTINYDDAPDEFKDPLLFEIMDDPMILPTSHMNVDRKFIEEYLLVNPIDPFNRNPLTKEELIPNVELKKKIDQYKLQKLKSIQNQKSKKEKININENNNKEENKEESKEENKEKNENSKIDINNEKEENKQ